MTHPLREHIDALLSQGKYSQAAALVAIDNWRPYELDDQLTEANIRTAELAQYIGALFIPVFRKAIKSFDDFSGVDFPRLE